ncbi:class I SAM-dependent methyltransferase [Campylobacter volucris]|uniref:class I SAM-dependent methyltransferase n=1 Tax=Campylobacter volucris TaxID=1031542 RepID=UPI00189D62AD|nr:class I SAM-dependent methyltransferase [Campylobacter volucris]MBF7045960.1 class I SAM-dependent methyltransferase [Campylobacter volucris]
MKKDINNDNALLFYANIAKTKNDIQSVKLANNTDYTDIDANFILKHSSKSSKILDLGSGTGLIVNKLYDKISHIDCVEFYKEFSKFIVQSPNINVYNQLLQDFRIEKKYDVITAFGVMHHFSEEEATKLYKKYFSYLEKDGKMIIKNQFGLKEDVIVNGYSEEQNTNYYAHYRYICKEIYILKEIGFKDVEYYDIYPPECNRWNNTHFYAIVASI